MCAFTRPTRLFSSISQHLQKRAKPIPSKRDPPRTKYVAVASLTAAPRLPPPNPVLRHAAISIYKELLHRGRDYPKGYDYFRHQLHEAFWANASLRDEGEIKKAIGKARHAKKELEALYSLKRYRVLEKRYNGK
ncbi:hypothetical protein F4814DRAFT_222283 [Daldinia grandis]|nr:hypothetical protein F4814DRAFT_222283 [Daldinia grandis]